MLLHVNYFYSKQTLKMNAKKVSNSETVSIMNIHVRWSVLTEYSCNKYVIYIYILLFIFQFFLSHVLANSCLYMFVFKKVTLLITCGKKTSYSISLFSYNKTINLIAIRNASKQHDFSVYIHKIIESEYLSW